MQKLNKLFLLLLGLFVISCSTTARDVASHDCQQTPDNTHQNNYFQNYERCNGF
ncbi:MAG: hypothetical protein ACPGJV_00460 [Bacteriovoracaceae bacterium]